MELGLKNKNVVITGGTRGIGFATAKEFLKEGARVTITGRDSARLDEAVQELKEYGTIFGCQAAIPYMKKTGGSIINIASLAARNATCGRSNIYASMKAGLVALSKTLAGEYAAYGIRVNTILPGYTKTPLVENTFSQEDLNKLLKNNLLHRMALPEEIAKPIVFLASDAASYITASSLEVSGGHNQVLNPEFSYEKFEKEKSEINKTKKECYALNTTIGVSSV